MGLAARFEQERQASDEALRADIIHHIITLLSSRRPVWGRVLDNEILMTSIAGLGMLDPPRRVSDWQGRQLAEDASDLLQRFEHRLRHIRVGVIEANRTSNRVQLHIEASLGASSMKHKVGHDGDVFDTRLEVKGF
ncbi:hypothetical protein GCM10023116_14520 [Kistimonas scapharcae]|uniref:IraD/Gp25-like domain-containing protein n=1 Tax=Kistimonas scapharcae TaxID=1036133 RepID=A0ABP8V179_9GAMM